MYWLFNRCRLFRHWGCKAKQLQTLMLTPPHVSQLGWGQGVNMHCFHAFIFFPPKVQLFLFFPQNIVLCKIKIKKQEIQNHCGPMKTNDRKCRGGLQICHYGICIVSSAKQLVLNSKALVLDFLYFFPNLSQKLLQPFSPLRFNILSSCPLRDKQNRASLAIIWMSSDCLDYPTPIISYHRTYNIIYNCCFSFILNCVSWHQRSLKIRTNYRRNPGN